MITKNNRIILCIFMVLFQYALWAQTFYTESANFSWTNRPSVQSYIYIPGGYDIHRVVLRISTGNIDAHDYFLTYPEGHSDYLAVGSAFNTNQDPTLGYSVSFLRTATPGTYELTIIKKDPLNSDTFTSGEVFGFAIDKLGVVNTLTESIFFYQIGLTPPVIPQPAGIVPNGCYWVESGSSMNTVNTYFQLRGADFPSTVHRVNLWFITTASPSDFTISANTFGAQLGASTTVNLPNQITINTDVGGSVDGVHLQLYNIGSGVYRMEIVANPQTCPMAGTDCEFDNNEYWQIGIRFPTGHKTVLSMQPLAYNSSACNSESLALFRPPVSVIRNPGNVYFENPAKVVLNREFRYNSDPFDSDTADGTLSYQWKKNSTNFTSHGTEQNPDFNESYGSIGATTIELQVSESITTSGFPYSNFTHSSKDMLTLSTVDPEYALFPPHVNLPYTSGDPPIIDGRVTTDFMDTSITSTALGDTGWNQAYMIAYQDGTNPHVFYQSLCHRSQDFIYESFEVRNDPTIDQNDSIVLAFSPDDSAATRNDDRIIVIYPFSASPATGENLLPYSVKIKKWNSGTSVWDWETLVPDGTGTYGYNIQVKIRNFGGTTGAWDVEARIPTSNVASGGTSWIDFDTHFLSAFVVFRADTTVPATPVVTEFKWPKASSDILGDAANYDYNPVWWSSSVKGPSDLTAYNGLYFTRNSILVTPKIGSDPAGSPGWNIMLPDCADADANNNSVLNTFEVTLLNTSKLGVNYVGLKNIDVAFSVAKWGIPGAASWIIIPSYLDTPVMSNPITDRSVGAGSVSTPGNTKVSLPWTVNCTDSTPAADDPDDAWILANYPGTHHCVFVEVLGAAIDDPSVTPPHPANLLISKMYSNFNFVTASEFSRVATIDTRGNGRPETGSKDHKYRISVVKHAWEVNKNDPDKKRIEKETNRPKSPGSDASGQEDRSETVSELYWSATGYTYTGHTVIINNKAFELLDPAGSFGYVVEHEGVVLGWQDDIEGADEIAEDTYELVVPLEGAKDVVTRIKPCEPIGLTASLHGGVSTPISTFANTYSTGWNAMIDLGIKVLPNMYLMGLADYNWFPSVSSSGTGTSIVNLALNAKYFIPVQPFLEVGIGAGVECTIQDFATFDFGYDACASLDYVINPFVLLELGAVYHSRFNQQYWFVQSDLGIVFRF